MNSPDKAHAANAIEYAAPASNISDRSKLLAMAEEEYCLTKKLSRSSRWQHPLQRSIEDRRRKTKKGLKSYAWLV
jgi:hypothetical protein